MLWQIPNGVLHKTALANTIIYSLIILSSDNFASGVCLACCPLLFQTPRSIGDGKREWLTDQPDHRSSHWSGSDSYNFSVDVSLFDLFLVRNKGARVGFIGVCWYQISLTRHGRTLGSLMLDLLRPWQHQGDRTAHVCCDSLLDRTTGSLPLIVCIISLELDDIYCTLVLILYSGSF